MTIYRSLNLTSLKREPKILPEASARPSLTPSLTLSYTET